MFEPNLKGKLQKRTGRNIHGEPLLSAAIDCSFAIVNLEVKALKTSVRADSSGSRGSADEFTAEHLRILISKFTKFEINDIFSFDGMSYLVISKHPRRSVFGDIDHYQCDLEILP